MKNANINSDILIQISDILDAPKSLLFNNKDDLNENINNNGNHVAINSNNKHCQNVKFIFNEFPNELEILKLENKYLKTTIKDKDEIIILLKLLLKK